MVVAQRGGEQSSVVQAFHAGDELAFATIYDRWAPLVYSLALRSTGEVSGAEAVTQRVFAQAWTSRRSFDATRDRLSAWLVGLTSAAIAETMASRSKPAELRPRPHAQIQLQMTTETQVANEIEPADLAGRLLLVDEVSRLEATPRQVLRLALFDGLSHAQIADRLGLASGTVRAHIRQGLLTLRQRLEVRSDAC